MASHNMNELSIIAILKYGSVAMFGAIVNAILEYRDGHAKTWMDFFALVIIGAFSGLMFGLLALAIFPVDAVYMHMMFIGAGAVLGREGLKVISRRVVEAARLTIQK